MVGVKISAVSDCRLKLSGDYRNCKFCADFKVTKLCCDLKNIVVLICCNNGVCEGSESTCKFKDLICYGNIVFFHPVVEEGSDFCFGFVGLNNELAECCTVNLERFKSRCSFGKVKTVML